MTANRRTRHCFIVIKAQEELLQTAERKETANCLEQLSFTFRHTAMHSVTKGRKCQEPQEDGEGRASIQG